jgi:hypothetical protein
MTSKVLTVVKMDTGPHGITTQKTTINGSNMTYENYSISEGTQQFVLSTEITHRYVRYKGNTDII